MKFIFTILFTIFLKSTFSQKSERYIKFTPAFNNLPLKLNKKYRFKNDSLEISTLKFYISNILLYQNETLIDFECKKYTLINFESPETSLIKFKTTNNKHFNRIALSIGIDSLTNVSGALGEDLDPTKGMYWTWQSGYVNLKLEGKSKICPSRNNEFSFHIGGYQLPFYSIQNVDFLIKNDEKIVFDLDISKLLNGIKLNEVYEVVSPSKKANDIAEQFSNIFKVLE